MAEICVVIARRRHSKLLEEMDEAHRAGARLLEIRLDFLAGEPRLHDILKARSCPVIATVRRKADGGEWRGNEAERQKVLRSAIAMGFDYVDLEEDTAREIPRFGQTKRIVSAHFFQGLPDSLSKTHDKLKAGDADVVKIAAKANHPTDNFRMISLLKRVKTPTVAFCMGSLGTPSRILGAKFGSPWTYAAHNPMRLVAPGMMTFAEVNEIYFYDRINSHTEVFGVIGDPIHQSLSPLVHNACFRARGINSVYLPFRVPAECLDSFIGSMDKGELRGLSVTIPHKQEILNFGNSTDPLVLATGSANTLITRGESASELFNTDGPAATEALESAIARMGTRGERGLQDKTVLVLGAGGVARTIVHCLASRGALVTCTNRSIDRAKELAHSAGCTFLHWSERHTRHFDVLVNCTKVGMVPEIDETPFHAGSLKDGMVVFDTVYNPENTRLISDAKTRGCQTVTGVEMFVRQAEAQFKLFTGQSPPENLMGNLVREELSPARSMLREARKAGDVN